MRAAREAGPRLRGLSSLRSLRGTLGKCPFHVVFQTSPQPEAQSQTPQLTDAIWPSCRRACRQQPGPSRRTAERVSLLRPCPQPTCSLRAHRPGSLGSQQALGSALGWLTHLGVDCGLTPGPCSWQRSSDAHCPLVHNGLCLFLGAHVYPKQRWGCAQRHFVPACVSSGRQTLALGTQQGRGSGCLSCSGPQPGREGSAVDKCEAYRAQCLQGGSLACALLQTPFSGDLFSRLVCEHHAPQAAVVGATVGGEPYGGDSLSACPHKDIAMMASLGGHRTPHPGLPVMRGLSEFSASQRTEPAPQGRAWVCWKRQWPF